MKLDAICHLLICTRWCFFFPLIWSCLLNCKGSGHAAEKQKVMTGASSKRWDFTRLKGRGGVSCVLIMEQQLYSAEIVVGLFCLSWRLVVVKHLRAKVLLFSPPFCLSLSFFVCSAVVTIVAHAKCLIFSRRVQPQTNRCCCCQRH